MNKHECETPWWIPPIVMVLVVIVAILLIRREAHQDSRIRQLRHDAKLTRMVLDEVREESRTLYREVHPEKCVSTGPGWGFGCVPSEKPAWEGK